MTTKGTHIAPVIGVVMALYRPDIPALKRQIASIMGQSGCSARLHLFADGPMEQLAEIRMLVSADSHISLTEFPENRGPAACFLAGLEQVLEAPAAPNYLAFADQDDIWLPEKLGNSIAALETSNAGAVHSDAEVVDQDGGLIAPSIFVLEQRATSPSLAQLFFRNNVTGMTLVMRRETARKVTCQAALRPDSWLHDHFAAFIALASDGLTFINIPLVRYVQHGGNVVGAGKMSSLAAPTGQFLDSDGRPARYLEDGARLVRKLLEDKCCPASEAELSRLLELLDKPRLAGVGLLARALIGGVHIPRTLAARLLLSKLSALGPAS